MEQRPRVVRGIVFICTVASHDRTHKGRAGRASTPANDAATLQNEQAVYVPYEKYRNP